MQMSYRILAAAVLVLWGLLSSPVWAGEVSVAVAANFAAPMEQIVALFEKESGHTVTMILEYDLYDIKSLKTGIEEKWVKDDGIWWLANSK